MEPVAGAGLGPVPVRGGVGLGGCPVATFAALLQSFVRRFCRFPHSKGTEMNHQAKRKCENFSAFLSEENVT